MKEILRVRSERHGGGKDGKRKSKNGNKPLLLFFFAINTALLRRCGRIYNNRLSSHGNAPQR